MINFIFFWPDNLEFPHDMSVKFSLWTFHKLKNGRKNLTLLTFGCPTDNLMHLFWVSIRKVSSTYFIKVDHLVHIYQMSVSLDSMLYDSYELNGFFLCVHVLNTLFFCRQPLRLYETSRICESQDPQTCFFKKVMLGQKNIHITTSFGRMLQILNGKHGIVNLCWQLPMLMLHTSFWWGLQRNSVIRFVWYCL